MPSRSDLAARLMELLGLSEEELCTVLDVDPLTILSGQLEQCPELPILVDLLEEPASLLGPPLLRRWVRAATPAGRPIELLLGRDFARFEEAVDDLAERGFVIGRGL